MDKRNLYAGILSVMLTAGAIFGLRKDYSEEKVEPPRISTHSKKDYSPLEEKIFSSYQEPREQEREKSFLEEEFKDTYSAKRYLENILLENFTGELGSFRSAYDKESFDAQFTDTIKMYRKTPVKRIQEQLLKDPEKFSKLKENFPKEYLSVTTRNTSGPEKETIQDLISLENGPSIEELGKELWEESKSSWESLLYGRVLQRMIKDKKIDRKIELGFGKDSQIPFYFSVIEAYQKIRGEKTPQTIYNSLKTIYSGDAKKSMAELDNITPLFSDDLGKTINQVHRAVRKRSSLDCFMLEYNQLR